MFPACRLRIFRRMDRFIFVQKLKLGFKWPYNGMVIIAMMVCLCIPFSRFRFRERRDNRQGIPDISSLPWNKPALYFKNSDSNFTAVPRGTNIQVGDLEVYLTTAVYYANFPAKSGVNIFLNGWARSKTPMDFKCCLLMHVDQQNGHVLVEIPAYTYHVYEQWVVDMQNAEFYCSMIQQQMNATSNVRLFRAVAFVVDSCAEAPPETLRIEYPERVQDSVGVCLKISYGSLNPEKIMEWFEFMKMVGVTRVFTFLSDDLSREARDMFMYYKGTGFLDADPIDPAKSKDGPDRGFRLPRFEQQAWIDEVMASNDCKHRMSGFDYVIVIDLDELIIPRWPKDTILSILKKTSRRRPNAGAFSFDSHVVMLNWNQSRPSPLHIMSKIIRTTFANYDGADRNTRWAFMPRRAYYAQNNKIWPRYPYTITQVPARLYTLVHRRLCKLTWPRCLETPNRRMDPLILRYEKRMVETIQQLPALDILRFHNHDEYVDRILAVTVT